MKVRCPECKTFLEVNINDYDEGDTFECKECGAALVVKISSGRIKLKTEKEQFYDDIDKEYGEMGYDED